MKSRMSEVSVIVMLFSAFVVCSLDPLLAQSPFSRNDNYDFAGNHEVRAGGSDPDHFSTFIESNSDFRLFKLHIVLQRFNLGAYWFGNQYRVDMNNDGIWELDWDALNDRTITYLYPNPPNGISANYTIKIEIRFGYLYGGSTDRTKYHQITIFSTPRVYADAENDAFVQLRNEDATAKIPVLMVEGFDPLNEKFPETYYNLTWDLVNSDLYPNGYEIFILNFHDGGRDLRPNANVLLKAIEKVHEICPNYKIAVAGLSMGGPITRYALAKKEGQGETHDVGLFLSYDSPQRWAHVNPGLQDWIKTLDPNEGAAGILQANLKSMGAKQMLGYDTYDPAHTFRNEFYNELNALNGDGYPHQSYNVSVSNGNFNATWGYESEGRHVMTLKINDNLINQVPAVRWDCGAGSMITDITTRRYGDVFANPFLRIYYELQIIFNPAYTMTWSALDLVNEVVDEQTGDIISFDRSKFDDYVVQTVPLQHHELSTLTRNKIMYWLNKDFTVGVHYNLPEGGSASPDNYQVNILHGIPITVQPKVVNVNGKQIVYYFSKWEDGNTNNPRVFYASHDVSHTATMKGHLVSTTPTTTGPNSQRKLLKVDNVYHLVYEGDGEIWYTYSSDGVTWSPEIRLSDGTGNSGAPSIALRGELPCYPIPCDRQETSIALSPGGEKDLAEGPGNIYVIHRKRNGGTYDIRVYEKDHFSGVWYGPASVGEPIDTVINPHPVIGWYSEGPDYPYLLAIWEGNHGLRHAIAAHTGNNYQWGSELPLSGVPSDARSPSLAPGFSVVGETFSGHLVGTYESGNKISTVRLYPNQVPLIEDVPASIGLTSYASQGFAESRTGGQFGSSPQVHVVWEAYGEEGGTNRGGSWQSIVHSQRRVIYQHRNDSKWEDAHEFRSSNPSVNYYRPTVNSLLDNTVVCAWDDGTQLYRATYDGNPWLVTGEETIGKVRPNLAVSGCQGLDASTLLISTGTSGGPYGLIVDGPISGSSNRLQASGIPEQYSRRVMVARRTLPSGSAQDSAKFFSVEVSSVRLKLHDGSVIPLDFTSETDSAANEETVWAALTSIPVVLPSTIDSIIVDGEAYARGLSGLTGSNVGLSFDVVDVERGTLLKRLNKERLYHGNSVDTLRFRDRVAGLAGRRVKVRPSLRGLGANPRKLLATIVHIHTLLQDSLSAGGSMLTKQGAGPTSGLPTSFMLHQNYPNPFNPTTEIRFDLPETGNVSLIVYDVLGRKVKDLTNGYREAGYHSAIWNAVDQASGVYFARFSVMNAKGEIAFYKVDKLLLMK